MSSELAYPVSSAGGFPTDQVLCCDWGTSFFRLRLMSASDYRCLGEVRSPMGVAGVFADWKRSAEPTGIGRHPFFRRQLSGQIDRLANQLNRRLTHTPIVMSGMASSSIGLEEVPYAALPFAVDGSQASIRWLDAQPDFPHPIMLISGVQGQQDVMRGEETELIGLLAAGSPWAAAADEVIYIFPGTHSKHMHLRNGQLVGFETYMTGELFDLMAHHSILADSVDVTVLADCAGQDALTFKRGVGEAGSAALLHSLFTVRTNEIFGTLTKKQNALYLSGLLIGTEMKHLPASPAARFVLAGSSALSVFYALAIDELGLGERTAAVPVDLVDQAASVGQLRLFQHQLTKATVK